jgi:hypothetical protein
MAKTATRTTVETTTIPAAAASDHRAIRRVSNAAVAEALCSAVINSDQREEAPAVFASIHIVPSAGEYTTPALNKDGKPVTSRDHTTVKSITSREYPLLSHEQSVTVLQQHDRASFTIASACASIIANHLIGAAMVNDVAKDGKLWKAIKTSCETIVAGESADIYGFSFPQQWENYFSAAKGYLAVGGDVTKLIYRNDQGADCVRTMQWLKAEAKRLDTSLPTTKAERTASSLSSVVESMLGGAEGKGEIISAGDVTVDSGTAKMLLDIAEANLGTMACRTRLQAEDCEQTLRRLIAQHGAEMIYSMVRDMTAA